MMRINFDYASGTPLLPEVKAAVAAALEEGGNPSSIHQGGLRAREQLEQARAQMAALINAAPGEVSFTSSGTESNNWAVKGLFAANKRKGSHLIISAIEHPSVALAAKRLAQDGAEVTILPVDRDGLVSPRQLKPALRDETALVSIMLANGEVGTIEPIKDLAAIAHEHGALFHTDAVAAVGPVAADVRELGVDALSFAANQFYGPSGAAGLFVRDVVRILPLLDGGGQEHGGRSGTEDVPAIVGMGVAAEIAQRDLLERTMRLTRRRNRLREGLEACVERLRVNGAWCKRLPHNVHVCTAGVDSEALVLGLDREGIAVGLGSACNAKSMRPSSVLKAMGLTEEESQGALVFTIGEQTTDAEIDRSLEVIPRIVGQLRRVVALTMRT